MKPNNLNNSYNPNSYNPNGNNFSTNPNANFQAHQFQITSNFANNLPNNRTQTINQNNPIYGNNMQTSYNAKQNTQNTNNNFNKNTKISSDLAFEEMMGVMNAPSVMNTPSVNKNNDKNLNINQNSSNVNNNAMNQQQELVSKNLQEKKADEDAFESMFGFKSDANTIQRMNGTTYNTANDDPIKRRQTNTIQNNNNVINQQINNTRSLNTQNPNLNYYQNTQPRSTAPYIQNNMQYQPTTSFVPNNFQSQTNFVANNLQSQTPTSFVPNHLQSQTPANFVPNNFQSQTPTNFVSNNFQSYTTTPIVANNIQPQATTNFVPSNFQSQTVTPVVKNNIPPQTLTNLTPDKKQNKEKKGFWNKNKTKDNDEKKPKFSLKNLFTKKKDTTVKENDTKTLINNVNVQNNQQSQYQQMVPQNNQYQQMAPQNNQYQPMMYQNNQYQQMATKNNQFQQMPPQNNQFQQMPPQNNQFQQMPPQNNQFQQMPPQNNQSQQMPPQNNQFRQMPPQNNQYQQMMPNTNLSQQTPLQHNQKSVQNNLVNNNIQTQNNTTKDTNESKQILDILNQIPQDSEPKNLNIAQDNSIAISNPENANSNSIQVFDSSVQKESQVSFGQNDKEYNFQDINDQYHVSKEFTFQKTNPSSQFNNDSFCTVISSQAPDPNEFVKIRNSQVNSSNKNSSQIQNDNLLTPQVEMTVSNLDDSVLGITTLFSKVKNETQPNEKVSDIDEKPLQTGMSDSNLQRLFDEMVSAPNQKNEVGNNEQKNHEEEKKVILKDENISHHQQHNIIEESNYKENLQSANLFAALVGLVPNDQEATDKKTAIIQDIDSKLGLSTVSSDTSKLFAELVGKTPDGQEATDKKSVDIKNIGSELDLNTVSSDSSKLFAALVGLVPNDKKSVNVENIDSKLLGLGTEESQLYNRELKRITLKINESQEAIELFENFKEQSQKDKQSEKNESNIKSTQNSDISLKSFDLDNELEKLGFQFSKDSINNNLSKLPSSNDEQNIEKNHFIYQNNNVDTGSKKDNNMNQIDKNDPANFLDDVIILKKIVNSEYIPDEENDQEKDVKKNQLDNSNSNENFQEPEEFVTLGKKLVNKNTPEKAIVNIDVMKSNIDMNEKCPFDFFGSQLQYSNEPPLIQDQIEKNTFIKTNNPFEEYVVPENIFLENNAFKKDPSNNLNQIETTQKNTSNLIENLSSQLEESELIKSSEKFDLEKNQGKSKNPELMGAMFFADVFINEPTLENSDELFDAVEMSPDNWNRSKINGVNPYLHQPTKNTVPINNNQNNKKPVSTIWELSNESTSSESRTPSDSTITMAASNYIIENESNKKNI